MGNIFVGLGLGLAAMCVLWLYGIALTKGWQFAVASILIPFTLLLLLGDEQGQKAWGGIFFGAVLAVVGIFINQSGVAAENARQADVAATQGVVYQITETTHQDQAVKGLAYLQNYQGVLDVSTTIHPSSGSGQITVNYVEFTSDGIKVFVDSVISNPNENTPDESCLLFHPENNNDKWVRPSYSDFQQLNDIPDNEHFVGYAFYPRVCTNDTCPNSNMPYSNSENRYLDFPVIPERLETILQTLQTTSSTVYFHHGCSAFFEPIKLFDYADFGSR